MNLLASSFKIDRDHSNTLVFSGSEGLDPQIDLRFKAPALSARIEGRASNWHSNVTITSSAGTSRGRSLQTCLYSSSALCLQPDVPALKVQHDVPALKVQHDVTALHAVGARDNPRGNRMKLLMHKEQ